MPKNKSKDSTVMPFHTYISVALVAGVTNITANPNGLGNGGRLLTEADGWAHFRIRKLKFRLHPGSTRTGNQAVGFVGGIQDTPPATVSAVVDVIPSVILGTNATAPTEWIEVPQVDLSGPLPWYKGIAGTADSTEEAPGQILICGTATDGFTLEIRGSVEFKVSLSTANTPAAAAARAVVREERIRIEREKFRDSILGAMSVQTGVKSKAP